MSNNSAETHPPDSVFVNNGNGNEVVAWAALTPEQQQAYWQAMAGETFNGQFSEGDHHHRSWSNKNRPFRSGRGGGD